MRFLRIAILLIASVPAPALAAAPRTWRELVGALVALMNNGVAVLVTLAIALYFFGVSSNIVNFGGEHGAEKRRSFFTWGIVAIFVMVSVWGILRVLQNTLFGGMNATTGPTTSAQCLFGNC